MKTIKVSFLVSLFLLSLCVIAIPVKSQEITESIYILSDGTIYSTTNATVPIQKDGTIYTFTDDILVYTFVVQRSGIIIDGAGYSLQGQGEIGFDLTGVSDVAIQNVQLDGEFIFGIYIWESSFNSIIGNRIKNNGSGILVFNCTQNTISDNTIIDNAIGIDLRLTSDNIFRNNNMNNIHNIAVYATQLSHYNNDMDDSNTIDDEKKVYYLIGEEDLLINPENYPDLGFLALVSCTNITVQSMELTNNVQGIILAGTTGSTIAQNNIIGNYYGIMLFGSSKNVITSNTLTENDRAIQLSFFSSVNSISANNITGNIGGMFLFNSTQNTISGNIIENNREYGIGFSASSFNLIRGNQFIDNGKQVVDPSESDASITPSINTWFVSYPIGGNYWSDYSGMDIKNGENQDQDGGDGIGDTAYVINNNNQDNYPLIPEGTLYVYITSPENKTYYEDSITLTYTTSETNAIVGYSLDGQANMTITGTTTLSNLSEGSHKLTVFAKDTEGNEKSNTVYFTISEEVETPSENEENDSFPTTLILLVLVILALVAIVLFYIFKIRKS